MRVRLRERVSLTQSQRGRPAEWKVKRPLICLALHCRAQAGNRKGNTTTAEARVLRVGSSGLWGKIILYFRPLVAQKLLGNFHGVLSVWDLSPPTPLCVDLCR